MEAAKKSHREVAQEFIKEFSITPIQVRIDGRITVKKTIEREGVTISISSKTWPGLLDDTHYAARIKNFLNKMYGVAPSYVDISWWTHSATNYTETDITIGYKI